MIYLIALFSVLIGGVLGYTLLWYLEKKRWEYIHKNYGVYFIKKEMEDIFEEAFSMALSYAEDLPEPYRDSKKRHLGVVREEERDE